MSGVRELPIGRKRAAIENEDLAGPISAVDCFERPADGEVLLAADQPTSCSLISNLFLSCLLLHMESEKTY